MPHPVDKAPKTPAHKAPAQMHRTPAHKASTKPPATRSPASKEPAHTVLAHSIDTRDASARETHDLIASDKVQGTKVYDLKGHHIGAIERLMLEKRSGRVSYAVLSFGGFLGLGRDYYPLPWSKLTYDETLGGYRTDVTQAQIERAPVPNGDDYDWSADMGRRIYGHYGVTPYWF